MKRAALAIAGTVAGTAGVLAFPVQKSMVAAPTTATGGTAGASAAAAPAASQSAAGPTASTAGGSATGADQAFRYGDIAVKVTVQNGRITQVQVTSLNETDGRSVAIDSYAVPQLEQQVVAANSANIDGISGATFTSQAFADSVASALQKLGFGG